MWGVELRTTVTQAGVDVMRGCRSEPPTEQPDTTALRSFFPSSRVVTTELPRKQFSYHDCMITRTVWHPCGAKSIFLYCPSRYFISTWTSVKYPTDTRHVRSQPCLPVWIYSRSTVFLMMANLAVWEPRLLHL